jgi:hypothetical protein
MENATDALKMGVAVLIFVAALSVAIMALSRAKQASDALITTTSPITYSYGNGTSSNNFISVREVGIDEVIPNIYSYYQNYDTILFYTASYNRTANTLTDLTPITLYYTDALNNANNLSDTPLNKSILRVDGSENRRGIYGLDINDERARQEPWASDQASYKKFLDSLVNNVDPDTPSSVKDGAQVQWYNWSRYNNQFLSNRNKLNTATHKIAMKFYYPSQMNGMSLIDNKNARFIERIGRYNYNLVYSNSTSTINGEEVNSVNANSVNRDKSRLYFKDEKGNEMNETLENQENDEKIVIQYIYIGQG